MRRGYNSALLAALIAVTVAICIVFAAIIVISSRDNADISGKDKSDNAVTENKETENKESEKQGNQNPEQPKKQDEVLMEENEPEPEKLPVTKEEPDKNDNDGDKAESNNEPEVSGTETDDSDWNLILANPWNSIPEDFTVQLTEIGSGHKVDSRIVNDLNSMMSDLRKAGHSAFVCSSYRTNSHQTNLYNNEVNDYKNQGYSDEDAAVEAAKWVAIPGTSEHQTGLAVDIMSSYYLVLDRGQEDTAEQQWLMANSYKYGFILRYPSDKSDITGIYYEPWHYRYVGKEAAKEIFEKGICFEEYLAL